MVKENIVGNTVLTAASLRHRGTLTCMTVLFLSCETFQLLFCCFQLLFVCFELLVAFWLGVFFNPPSVVLSLLPKKGRE